MSKMMSVRRWDPFTMLARMDDDFDEIVRRSWSQGRNSVGWVPPIDMVSQGPDVVISLELPGLDPADIDIEVHEGRLTISGERRSEYESAEGKVLVRELRYGSFRREFVLPEGLEEDAVHADYRNGVLKVRVSGVSKPPAEPKKIAISQPSTISAEAVTTSES